MDARDLGGYGEEIGARISAIDRDLKWELGARDKKRLTFALAWDGSLHRRRLAERWLAHARANDPRWSYFAARPPSKSWNSLTMDLGGHEIDFSKFVCTFTKDASRERVDAVIFHPTLAKAREGVRSTATFVMLDRMLGEDGVERLLGVIEIRKSKPKGARPIRDLATAVTRLSRTATGEQFALYKGTRDGAPIFIVKNEALKPIDHLTCDHFVSVALRYPSDSGLPSQKDSVQLDSAENALLRALGKHVAYLGRETHANTRSLFLFAPRDARVKQQLAAWQKQRRAKIAWTADPEWNGLSRWD